MSSNDSDEKKKNKFGTIGGAWAPTITTNVVKRIIDAKAFREDLKEKAKTIQSPNNNEYRKMVDEESHMGGGFIPPTEEELKGGFDDGGILYNGKDR